MRNMYVSLSQVNKIGIPLLENTVVKQEVTVRCVVKEDTHGI